MFTGIVQTQAVVNHIQDKGTFRHLELRVGREHLRGIETGASIAVNGCCLTVTSFDLEPSNDSDGSLVRFDIIDETLRLTNLGELELDDSVNFERSLTMGKELGGHIVSGHIHTTATLKERIDSANNCRMYFEIAPKWLDYILAKGFIAVDGASLTVGDVTASGFWLHLIPETLAITILGDKRPGQRVNIEADQQTMTIVETVRRVLAKQAQ
ncbi:riboflavin synthase subunit alpha [Aliidiomarina halalkaliphila]|uniref:Riboflavin synthase n=1 Tax=Aliidiomarina halalkaliphila TaxID=2593535 RepID=A0A552X4D5_9GAMM|nr:riboflavin synthase subunit alpha [Aliidiomarina halalkaliphila]TRW49865.1 riboflavin synthase subunit alpha [Aliidiomarina halalkaliphila]